MDHKITKKFAVLFQSDNSSSENKYVELLKGSCINPKSISTLSFNFINEDKLSKALSCPEHYSALIFTSTRAVGAVSSALNLYPESCKEKWKEKSNFSVGKATAASALSLLNFETLGSDTGNSENLCHYIIEKFEKINKPLLFPCSNIRRDTISDILSHRSIPVEEIICYETVPNPQFENLWNELVMKEGLPEILIFFSPSGVQYCGEIVRNSYFDADKPKFIAIGPTTGKALLDAQMEPCKISEKPNPESVLKASLDIIDSWFQREIMCV